MAPTEVLWKHNEEMAERYAKSLKGGVAGQVPLLPALELVNRSGILNAKAPIKLLDNASGPATLVEVMYPQLSDDQKNGIEILCTDIAAPMIELAQKTVKENGWKGVSTRVLDSNDLSSLPDSHFTHILTGLGVMFLKDPDAVFKDIHRMLVPGGINAFSTWKRAQWFDHIQEAFKLLVPGAPEFPSDKDGMAKLQYGHPWDNENWIKEKVSKYFVDVGITTQSKVHMFPLNEFLQLYGGPMIQGMLGMFWGAENGEKYKDMLHPTLEKYFQQKGATEVDVLVEAIIIVAKKA